MTPSDPEITPPDRHDPSTATTSPSDAVGRARQNGQGARRIVRLARGTASLIAVGFSAVVLLLAAGNLFPAGENTATLIAAEAWAVVGPLLVLLSVLATALALPSVIHGAYRTRRTIGVALLAAIALACSATITGVIIESASANGGSVDLVQALDFSGPSPASNATERYLTIGGSQLTALIYRPAHIEASTPVLMYIHGGGWTGGSARQSGATARWFADRGWLVVNVNYRLATTAYPTWNEAPADVGCALSWSAQQAHRMGIDADRLVVMGNSAGGNLAIDLGWSASTGRATSSCPDRGKVPVPGAVVASYPVADPGYTYAHGRSWFGESPQASLDQYLGGRPSEHPDRLATISPTTYLTPEDPPTLIVQPERDDFVPAQGNYLVARAAFAAGVNVEVVRVPFAHHSFDSNPSSLGGQVSLSITAHWLATRGLAPPTR